MRRERFDISGTAALECALFGGQTPNRFSQLQFVKSASRGIWHVLLFVQFTGELLATGALETFVVSGFYNIDLPEPNEEPITKGRRSP